MKWPDIPLRPTSRVLRQFAWTWLIALLAVGAYQHLARGRHWIGATLAVAAVALGGIGVIRPESVRWLFVGLMLVTFPIGWIVSQLMLLIMFYVIITPLALLLRLSGRDALARKPAPQVKSFWQSKKMPLDVRSYFRQY